VYQTQAPFSQTTTAALSVGRTCTYTHVRNKHEFCYLSIFTLVSLLWNEKKKCGALLSEQPSYYPYRQGKRSKTQPNQRFSFLVGVQVQICTMRQRFHLLGFLNQNLHCSLLNHDTTNTGLHTRFIKDILVI